MLKEFVRFTKKRPINGLTLAVVSLYAGSKVLNAFKAPEGEFWSGVNGIGASTSTTTSSSSSHRLNPHCHCGGSMGVGIRPTTASSLGPLPTRRFFVPRPKAGTA